MKFGVAAVNGTAALQISLLVAGVEPDDEVLVSTLTFIAPANAVRYVGAWPVFIDAEPDYWQIDVDKGRALPRTGMPLGRRRPAQQDDRPARLARSCRCMCSAIPADDGRDHRAGAEV